jgi:hypothetical protein
LERILKKEANILFEQRRSFNYRKISAYVATAIIVFGSGFYIGSRTASRDVHIKNTANIEQAKVQKPYDLNQDCEVWLQNEGETETNYKRTYIMAGVVPNEVLGKTENEIKNYFKNEYPGKTIKSLSKDEIVLEDAEYKSDDKVDTMSDNSKRGKYAIETDKGHIALYKYDKNGKKSLVEKTKITMDSLPKTVQEEIEKGVIMDTEDEAYARLEDFAS